MTMCVARMALQVLADPAVVLLEPTQRLDSRSMSARLLIIDSTHVSHLFTHHLEAVAAGHVAAWYVQAHVGGTSWPEASIVVSCPPLSWGA